MQIVDINFLHDVFLKVDNMKELIITGKENGKPSQDNIQQS